MTLPLSGPVERYAQLRFALDKPAFLAQLPGVAAFIRLDERGGDDEPAPWAFHGSGLPLPVDVPSTDEDIFVDRIVDRTNEGRVDPNESTMTGPTFKLSIPPARGRATLLVVPRAKEITLGRERSCGVCVTERSVSKHHATLLVDGGSFTLVDEGARNGVTVNGRRIEKRGALRSGDVVELGDVALLFVDLDDLWDGLPRLAEG